MAMQFDHKKLLYSPLPSCFQNLEGRVVACNDVGAEILDLRSREDVQDKLIRDLIAEQNLAIKTEQTIIRVGKTLKPEMNLMSFTTNINNPVIILHGMYPCFNEDGLIEGIYSFGVPLQKSGKSFMSNCLSEQGLPCHYLNIVQMDSQLQHPLLTKLSKKEQKILSYFLMGLTAKLIAKQLHISYRTVETHINNIKHKFSVATKDQLIEFCHETALAQILELINHS